MKMECNEETESLNKRQNEIKLKLKNSRILKKNHSEICLTK